MSLGHVAELFDQILDSPDVDQSFVDGARRSTPPVVLDSYGLFDKKLRGDWRIVGSEDGFVPEGCEDVFVVYGIGTFRKVDIYGSTSTITAEQAKNYPPYEVTGDAHVKRLLGVNGHGS